MADEKCVYVYYKGKKVRRDSLPKNEKKGETHFVRNKETGLLDVYVNGKKDGSIVTMGDLIDR